MVRNSMLALAVCWYFLLINGEEYSAPKENPFSGEKIENINEVPSQSINDQQQDVQDPLVQMKHSKSFFNQGQKQNTHDANDFQAQNQQQNQQPKDPFQQHPQHINQPFQQTQQFSQPFQTNQGPQFQPNQNVFWQNPLSFLKQSLFGDLGLSGIFGLQPQTPYQTHSETLLHHNKDPALPSPVEGFNPPGPASHQEVAQAHRNWFESQVKSMQDKVHNWFKS